MSSGKITTVFVFAFLMFSCSSRLVTNREGSMNLRQKHTTAKVCKTLDVNYLLYVPQNENDPQKKLPLLIFLHGAGERGNDLKLVTKHGPPKLIAQGRDFPFIVVAPQCPSGEWWSVPELDLWLDQLLKELPVDKERIYLTGLSMGGFGTWAWATERPDRFAAIAPICGGGEPFLADRLKNIPVWVFHGVKDPVVPIRRSEEMVEALKKAGADVRFTVYPEAGHDSWTETYDNPELYRWFLKHKISVK